MSIWGSTIKTINPTGTIKPIAISNISHIGGVQKTEPVTPIVYHSEPVKKTFFQKMITLNGLINRSYATNNSQFLYIHYIAYITLIVILLILLYEYIINNSVDSLSFMGVVYFVWFIFTKVILEFLTPTTEILVNGTHEQIKLPIYHSQIPLVASLLLLP